VFVSLSMCVSQCMFLLFSVDVCLIVYVLVCVCVCFSVCICVSLYVYVSKCVCVSQCVCLRIFVSLLQLHRHALIHTAYSNTLNKIQFNVFSQSFLF